MELGIGTMVAFALGGLIVWVVMRFSNNAQSASIKTRLDDKEASVRSLTDDLKSATVENSDLKARLSGEVAAREQERLAASEKLALLREAQEELVNQFQTLSRKALDSNNKSFLELAKTQVEHLL
ncbi:MAG: DNA recombination protein RmuC, partial [Bacteroidetes bacterium]|nr:DNA recombination protein RmuC [Bacteroidota bacterium]